MNIKKVTIVGGGSSGWMTAAALSKNCPHLDITLVEAPEIKTVGVGESTLGHINRFLEMVGLKDEEWMPACQATYKNSIRFTNFREGNGESFHYPFFADYDYTDKYKAMQTWGELATYYPEEFPPETFSQMYAPSNTLLADYNKQTDNKDGILRQFRFKLDVAYHMDAALFGKYLKDAVALKNGVKHILNEIVSHEKDEEGNISKIICKDGLELTSDLWIDCTGFRSQLLEQWMGSEFISFSNILANDMAWASPIEYKDREAEMVNYTDCYALTNGWVWNTPLWSRMGSGYVFSSKFIDPEDAKKEYLQHISDRFSPEQSAKMEPRLIKIRHGKRKHAWVNNVVGIGLSYGFVEPLESTGLLTTHENIIRLIDTLNRRNGYTSKSERDAYSHFADILVTGFSQFVSAHYAFSQRTDSPYWKWATQENEYQQLLFSDFLEKQDLYGNAALKLANNEYDPTQQGTTFILAGMGVKNISTKSMIKHNNEHSGHGRQGLEDSRKKHHQHMEFLKGYIKTLPTNYQFMKDRIYGGKDEYAE